MEQMRLDRFLANNGCGTRNEVKKLLRAGLISCNGEVVKDPAKKISPDTDRILCRGEQVNALAGRILMLNKQAGYITATSDRRMKTVMDLIGPAYAKDRNLFPVGRLDRDTEGLLLLMDDGELAHRLLSPAWHVEKEYEAVVTGTIGEAQVRAFADGLDIGDEEQTMPAGPEVLWTGTAQERKSRDDAEDSAETAEVSAARDDAEDAAEDAGFPVFREDAEDSAETAGFSAARDDAEVIRNLLERWTALSVSVDEREISDDSGKDQRLSEDPGNGQRLSEDLGNGQRLSEDPRKGQRLSEDPVKGQRIDDDSEKGWRISDDSEKGRRIGDCSEKDRRRNDDSEQDRADARISCVRVRIREGRYHQVKRMFEAVGSRVLYLRRTAMGPVRLDESLATGQVRLLREEEIQSLRMCTQTANS